MASKRSLAKVYLPSGETPKAKSKKKPNTSGKQCRLIQESLQAQIKNKLRGSPGGTVLLSEIQKAITGPNKGDRSVWYAMKTAFPEAVLKKRVYTGVVMISDDDEQLATPLEPDDVWSLSDNVPVPTLKLSSADECPEPYIVPPATPTVASEECNCIDNVIRAIQAELKELASKPREDPSILRTSASELHKLKYTDYEEEFKSRTPTLARVITESVEKNDQPASASKKTAVTTVLCKLACIYNMNLNAYQKQVGLTLRSSRLTKTSINRFSRLYDSVSYKTMTKMLRQYSKDTNELMKEWEKEEVIHCGDNLDIRSTVRFEGDSKSYHDLHMYNNMVYKSPIPTTNLSDDIPTVDVGDIDYSQFLLTVDEEDRLMKAMSFSVLNSWRNNVEMCTNINVTPPPNKYGDLMVLKTQKLHAGVILKNESKTDEMIEILEYCNNYPTPVHPAKVPYRGDVGTYRVCKKALMTSDKDLPFVPCIGAFHLQMEWCQVIFDMHFDERSGRDPTGIYALKTLLKSTQVKADTRRNYYAASHLLDKILDGMLVEAARHKLDTTDVLNEAVDAADQLITQIYGDGICAELPSDICPICNKKYKHYNTLKKHIITKHPESMTLEGEVGQPDLLHKQSMQLMKLLLLKRCMDFSIKSGDGGLLSLIIKHMMLYFHQLGYTNYANASVEHVGQCQLFLSQRMRELITYDCFVNNTGKPLNCVPQDQDLEHSNLFFKNHFRLASSNPSPQLLDLYSKSQNKLEMVLVSFFKQFGIQEYSSERVMDSDIYKRDIMKIANHIKGVSIFTEKPGRLPDSDKLRKSAHDPLLLLDMFKLKEWLITSMKRMSEQSFLHRFERLY